MTIVLLSKIGNTHDFIVSVGVKRNLEVCFFIQETKDLSTYEIDNLYKIKSVYMMGKFGKFVAYKKGVAKMRDYNTTWKGPLNIHID